MSEQEKMDQAALATLHLNSSVYELMEGKDGDTKPLFKQNNNPLLVKGIVIERRIKESCNQVFKSIEDLFEFPDNLKKMALYPIEYMDADDTQQNYTVAYGWMIEYEKADPSKPVSVMHPTPENMQAAMEAALTPQPKVVPFVLAIPETDRYMFSLSLEHVPSGAIVPAGADNADEEIPDHMEESDASTAE